MNDVPCSPMPQYVCHKKVWALKIKSFERCLPTIDELERILNDNGGEKDLIGGYLIPENAHFARIAVSQAYVRKHNPEAGGYYVAYEDGYQSFSPAKAFEDGYTLVA